MGSLCMESIRTARATAPVFSWRGPNPLKYPHEPTFSVQLGNAVYAYAGDRPVSAAAFAGRVGPARSVGSHGTDLNRLLGVWNGRLMSLDDPEVAHAPPSVLLEDDAE